MIMKRLFLIAAVAAAVLFLVAGAARAQTGEGPVETKKAVDASSKSAPKEPAAKPAGKDAKKKKAPAAGQPADTAKDDAKGDAAKGDAAKDKGDAVEIEFKVTVSAK